MKIAISGCAGIGKTTLANRLAAELRVPLIDENYEPIFQSPEIFSGPVRDLAAALLAVHEKKRALESQHGSFVTDRCPVDIFNIWLNRGLGECQQETADLFEQCLAQVRQYDLLIFPPFGVLEMQQTCNANDGRKRNLNPWGQYHSYRSMVGLATLWMEPGRLLYLPASLLTIAARVEYVLEVGKTGKRISDHPRPA